MDPNTLTNRQLAIANYNKLAFYSTQLLRFNERLDNVESLINLAFNQTPGQAQPNTAVVPDAGGSGGVEEVDEQFEDLE